MSRREITVADPVRRAAQLLAKARYSALSCVYEGKPWCATVNYVVTPALELLFYSSPCAIHSQAIRAYPEVAASLYIVNGDDIHGAQLVGVCKEIHEKPLIERFHAYYYDTNFPDPKVRAEWLIPVSSFCDEGRHRFYVLTVRQLWVNDIDNWPDQKVDQRVEVELKDLRHAWPNSFPSVT